MIKVIRSWWRRPDHYNWVTSFLAAREAQVVTCQLIAMAILALGAVPIAMLWSADGPQGRWPRAVSIAVAACCVVMALVWLRRRWLTRLQSTIFVIVSSCCIAAASLAQANPVAGLLWATAFAVLGGYIAIFHTAHFLAFNLAVSYATVIVLAVRAAAASSVVWAVTAAVFVALVNTAVPWACQGVVHLLDIKVLNTDIEPLTGHLNRDAFYREAGNLISRVRDTDKQLVILVINLDNLRLLWETDGAAAGDRALVAIGQTLREHTRHYAIVGNINHDEFVVADTFSSTDSFPLVERVRGAIAATPPRLTASIGVASTPLRGLGACSTQDLLQELIAVGTMAMYDARRAGGNQARYVVCANPAAAAAYPSSGSRDDDG